MEQKWNSAQRGTLETDRDQLVQIWRRCGGIYNVDVPEGQPMPEGEGWDRPVPESSDTGTIDAQFMKHWGLFSAPRTAA